MAAKKKKGRAVQRSRRDAGTAGGEDDGGLGGGNVGRTMARRRVSEIAETIEAGATQGGEQDNRGGSMARKAVSEAHPLGAIIGAKEAVEDDLLQRPGVTGVDVGYKYVGGKRTNQLAIRVLVRKKGDVPTTEQVDRTISGIPTDVIERTFELHVDTGRYTPVRGGISIGPCRAIGGFVFTGTLGAIVRDNATGNPMLLSNFHVMCVDAGWAIGDQMAQPSRVDTGSCPSDMIGTLQRAVLSASVDGAVSSLVGRTHSCEIVDIGNVAGTTTATMGMAVRKRGRTTGLTHGIVDSVSLSVNLDYGDGIGNRTLTNQIGIAPDTGQNPSFGDRGDSGSVVVNAARQVVGLYFAGSSDGTGVANPIAAVLNALNVSMCIGRVKDPKSEIKELKREKPEVKEISKEVKNEKLETKELKREKPEVKEISKEVKNEKLETKELKLEIKEKLEKVEIERQKIPDTGGRPPILGPTMSSSLEERVAQLEQLVGQLTPFITPEERPDLATGALLHEQDGDGGGELSSMSQQLEKEASDAMESKANYDIKPGSR